jgi:lysyl endopeptidase
MVQRAAIMNTCSTNRPFFLTANHCYAPPGQAVQDVTQWRFTFQAWSAACTPSQNSAGVTFNGSTLRANWNGSDFCLVEMDNTPAANSGIRYAGWNRNTSGTTEATIIHHPAGDVMKITKDVNAPVTSSFMSAACWELHVDDGATEGGTSGAPYFDQNHRIVAQHYGVSDANLAICDREIKHGGKFDASWTGGGTNATRLSNWLDPSGSAAMTTNTTNISQLAPNNLAISGPGEFCTTTSSAYSITNLPPGASVAWTTSYSEGLVTPDCPGCTSTTLTRVFDGFVNLTATITNLCGLGTIVLNKNNISAGFPYFGVSPTGSDTAFPNSNYPFSFSMPPGYPGVSYFWRVPSGWSISYGQGTDYVYVHTGPMGSGGAVELDVTACGVTRYTHKYVEIGYGGSWIPDVVAPGSPQLATIDGGPDSPFGTKKIFKEKYLKINPNPARDRAVLALLKNDAAAVTDDFSFIEDVQVIDKTGRTLKRFRFNNKQTSQNISLEGLSPDLYIVMVYDGKEWFSDKLIVVK